MINTDKNAESYFANVLKYSPALQELTERQKNEVLTCLYVYAEMIDKRWIHEAMPPEIGKLVLVCRHSGEIITARYTTSGWHLYFLLPSADSNPGYVKADPVTHWMYLPKPFDSGEAY